MAKQVPWDEETELFVADLDAIMQKKYALSFRSMLLNPQAYVGKKGMEESIGLVKDDVNAYFADLLENMGDEQQKLQVELESATAQYKQVDSLIENKSAMARVPYIRPMFISRNPDEEETITVEQYGEHLDAFIGKLVNSSTYVADTSAKYKDYFFGSWLFSGAKNYVLVINAPASPVLVIENSRNVLTRLIEDIASKAAE